LYRNKASINRKLSCLKLYKKLRVLEQYGSACYAHIFVPSLLLTATVLFFISTYVCLKLVGKIPMPGFLLFPGVLVNCIGVLLLMTNEAANVFGNSKQVLDECKIIIQPPHKSKLVYQMAAACTPMKVRFGQNFIDKLTPLIMMNFCLSQTVSILLIH